MKPQKGEFWIVEAFGKVTIAEVMRWRPTLPNETVLVWRLFSGAEVLCDVKRPDFRAVRKIDVGALLDQPAPVAWRWRIKGDGRWTLLDEYPEGAMTARSEAEALYRGHPPQSAQLMKQAAEFIRYVAKEFGGCDHSVGICACADFALADRLEAAAIAAPAPDLGAKLDRAMDDCEKLIAEVERLREELKGTLRTLWLVVKSAGAPDGVTVDREDMESFDATRAVLNASTDERGNAHIEAGFSEPK